MSKYTTRLIGQETVVSLLTKFLNAETHNRTLLFNGPVSCGKSTAAKMFAADLLEDNRPLREVHPDCIILKEEHIGNIERVKEWKSSAYKAPFEQGKMVLILERVDLLSPEAANSLLKLLEEPPEKVTIILTALSIVGVLDTIQSRSMRIMFKEMSFEDKLKIVQNKGMREDAVERVVFSPSLGAAIFSNEFVITKQVFADAKRRVASIPNMSVADMLTVSVSMDPLILAKYLLAAEDRPKVIAAALECLGMCSFHVKPQNACLYLLQKLRELA